MFPPGSIIAPGRTLVLASALSPTSFRDRFPGVIVDGWFPGSLADGGERLALRDRDERVVTSVEFDDERGWPRGADGSGPSLELVDPAADPRVPAHWRDSRSRDGSPGLLPSAPPGIPVIRLNEVYAAGQGASPDWIELANTGSAPADLSGWSLVDDGGETRRFTLPPGTTLAAGGFLVVPCRGSDGVAGAPTGALEAAFALDRDGETIGLFDAAGLRVDVLSFGPQLDDATVARLGDDAAWRPGVPTPGAPNTAHDTAPPDAVTINEFLANPEPGRNDWIELLNRDATRPAAIGGYAIETAQGHARIAPLTFIPPRGFQVLAADEKPGPTHLDLRLPASGGFLVLRDPAGQELERLAYTARNPGESVGRLPDGSPTLETFAGTASPGSGNFPSEHRGPFLNEVLAWNQQPLPGAPGQVPAGWVELFNPTSETLDLSGMALGVERDPARAWLLPPGTTLAAGGHLVLRCDPRLALARDAADRPNTGLALGRLGGGVFLFDARGRLVDALEHGFQVAGHSLGKTGLGWQLLAPPTPEAPNAGPATLDSPASVRINEFLASSRAGDDWVELHHPGTRPVALAGCRLSDHPGLAGSTAGTFPPLSFLGPKGFLRIDADGRPAAGPAHAAFQLAAEGEALLLVDASGQVIDEVYFGRQRPDVSLGRLPDGAAGAFQPFERPTPGQGNATATASPPTIASLRWDAGDLVLAVSGEIGPAYRIEATPDWTTWTGATPAVRPAASPFELRFPGPLPGGATFLRVVAEP